MSIKYDTLEYNGTERTFTGWGFALDNCFTHFATAKSDTFSVQIPGANIADDPVFPYEAAVVVRTGRFSDTGADNTFSDGTTKFQGRRITNPLKVTGKKWGAAYEFHGPWRELEITQYLQTYKGVSFNTQPGEVVLNTAAFPAISGGGLRFISAGDQIQSILQFVLDSYSALGLAAPFKYVGRNLNAGAINLDLAAGPPGPPNENTDAAGNPYIFPLNAGTTIDLSLFKLFLKSEIIRPMAATQCIQKLLEWSPRTNICFDYTTTPPTVFFSNIDNSADVVLALFDRINHKSIELQRLDDLVPTSIVVNYRITSTSGSSSSVDVVPDKWGPHGSNNAADPSAGPGVVIQTLDLQGSNTSFASGQLDCEPLACIGGTHASRRVWWANHRGGEQAKLLDFRVRFQDSAAAATSIPDAKIFYASNGFDSAGTAVTAGQEFTAADYAFFIFRLVRGTQHAWMTVGRVPVKSVKVRITAKPVTYTEYDATGTSETDTTGKSNNPRLVTADLHTSTVELTNGVTGPYSTDASSTPGESYIIGPGGIAQYLFNMLATPQYEGEYVKVEVAFAGGISLRNRVNLSGGRAEWATMHAQIQEIKEDWGDRETSIRIGVAKHLNAEQLSALLNMARYRRAWYNPLLKADNTVASSGEIDMPITAGQVNSVEGLENSGSLPITLYTTPPTGSTPGVIAAQINNNPQKIADILAATTPTPVGTATLLDCHTAEPREVPFCQADGTTVFMVVVGGAFYSKP